MHASILSIRFVLSYIFRHLLRHTHWQGAAPKAAPILEFRALSTTVLQYIQPTFWTKKEKRVSQLELGARYVLSCGNRNRSIIIKRANKSKRQKEVAGTACKTHTTYRKIRRKKKDRERDRVPSTREKKKKQSTSSINQQSLGFIHPPSPFQTLPDSRRI
jgi:hypothetical protein